MPAGDAIRIRLRSLAAAATERIARLAERLAPPVQQARSLSAKQVVERLKHWKDRALKLWLVAVLLAIAGGAVYVVTAWEPVTEALCSVDVVRREVCRPHGLGKVPTPAQEERYRLALRDCPSLRHYIRTESPESPLYAPAKQRWDTRLRQYTRETQLVRTEQVVATSSGRRTRAVAIHELTEMTRSQASELCQRYARIPRYRLQSIRLDVGEPLCVSYGTGWTCTSEGRADCAISWLRNVEEEQC